MDFRSLFPVIKEFLKALKQKRTYNITENWYCFFGILWGIPVPVVTMGIDLYAQSLPVTLSEIVKTLFHHPIHFFFFLHPVFFGIVFGAMGTVRYNKDQEIEESERNLINKNSELEEANRKLLEANEMKSNFLSMITHELRTPLTTIKGYITFLKSGKGGGLNQTQKEWIDITDEETEHLNHLIEELIDLSKKAKGNFRVDLQSVQMKEVVDRAFLFLQPFAANQNTVMENNLPQDLPQVWADPEKILQVVTNLLENAIKFNKPDGRVSFFMKRTDERKIVFCVSDTGIGIPEEHKENVFENFFQVDSSGKRRYGGCGLGLAISKNIIDLHNGAIWVDSKPGAGTKVFFELLRTDKMEYNI